MLAPCWYQSWTRRQMNVCLRSWMRGTARAPRAIQPRSARISAKTLRTVLTGKAKQAEEKKRNASGDTGENSWQTAVSRCNAAKTGGWRGRSRDLVNLV